MKTVYPKLARGEFHGFWQELKIKDDHYYNLYYTPDDNHDNHDDSQDVNHDSHDDLDGNDYDDNDDFDVDQPARVIPVRMMPNEERMIGMRAKAEDQEIYCTCAKEKYD